MSNKYVVSLKDIALETGVSVSTVSRVIKKKGEIADETRKRVLLAAKRRGYHDNLLIEGMRTGRTRTIGVMVAIDDYFFNRIVQGIHYQLRQRGYLPILAWANNKIDDEQTTMHRLIEQRVEGIIMVPSYDLADTDYFLEVIERGLPIVTVDRQTKAAIDFVGTDDYLGGRLSAEHLYQLDHRCFGYYQGPLFASPAVLRRQGFCDYLIGCADAEVHLLGNGNWNNDNLELLTDVFRSHPDITAAAAFNDNYAAQLCDVVKAIGWLVPDNLAVVGFGDLPSGWYSRPALTTLDQQPTLLAETAVERLFSMIEHGSDSAKPQDIRIPPRLVVNDSTRKNKPDSVKS